MELRSVYPHITAVSMGGAVWFGVQAVSGKDNFSDEVNLFYFGTIYAAAALVGLFTTKGNFFSVSATLLLSQGVFYLIYPNIDWGADVFKPLYRNMLRDLPHGAGVE